MYVFSSLVNRGVAVRLEAKDMSLRGLAFQFSPSSFRKFSTSYSPCNRKRSCIACVASTPTLWESNRRVPF